MVGYGRFEEDEEVTYLKVVYIVEDFETGNGAQCVVLLHSVLVVA